MMNCTMSINFKESLIWVAQMWTSEFIYSDQFYPCLPRSLKHQVSSKAKAEANSERGAAQKAVFCFAFPR